MEKNPGADAVIGENLAVKTRRGSSEGKAGRGRAKAKKDAAPADDGEGLKVVPRSRRAIET